MKLVEYGREAVVTASPDASLGTLANRMAESNVGSVIVVDGSEPVGIVTDRDLAVRGFDHEDPASLTAGDVMTADVVTVENDRDVFEATSVMYEAGVRRLPITEDGELVGIVTLDDLTLLLVTELANLRDVIAWETPKY